MSDINLNAKLSQKHGIDFNNINLVEKQKKIYNNIVQNISEPPSYKKKFAKFNNQKLGLLLVEFRCHEWLKGVLYNMTHIYGNTNTVLYIVHGLKNEKFIKEILKDWLNIVYLKIDVDNIDVNDYSKLLTCSEFWLNFKTEFILVFQTDTLIFKKITDEYYEYSYTGAPLNPNFNICHYIGRVIQNGGFSLRNIKNMIEICNKYKYDKNKNFAEDVFFCQYLPLDNICPTELAKSFSVEHVYNSNPIGHHQTYRFQIIEDIKKWCLNVNGFEDIDKNGV
jgi:hypothetical protein